MLHKKKYYPDPDNNVDFQQLEESVLKFWKEHKIFEKSIQNRESKDHKNDFVFFDGPPFANGLPHYGHLLAGYIKDTVARYQTMQGKRVLRRFGWDCHGLPAEMSVEKKIGVSGRKAIQEYGIAKFNDECKKDVLAYVNEWKNYVERSGRWVDFDNGYKTMDLTYMESVINVFKQLYDKGLLYEDFRVMPYSWTCQTPLSNAETKMDNSYREKTDKAITVKFKLSDNKFNDVVKNNSIYVLAWTTTPWTLPSNLALAVNKDFDYVLISKDYNTGFVNEKLGLKLADFKNQEDIEFLTSLQKDQGIKSCKICSNNLDAALRNKDQRIQESKDQIFIFYKKDTKEYIGYSNLAEKNNSVFYITYCVKSDFGGQGYGYEILSETLNYIYGNTDADIIIESNLTASNLSAIKICEKCHFSKAKEDIKDFVKFQITKAIWQKYNADFIKTEKEYYIIGKSLLNRYKKELANLDGNFTIIKEFKGDTMVGMHYEPILPYFKDLKDVKANRACFSILHGDFVTTEDGTGIVHIAPGFGEDDHSICKPQGIPTICPVDDGGCFTDIISDYCGTQVFETNDPIILRLKKENKWLKTEQYVHNYPHCWRTDAPLIYKAVSSWYVKVTELKDKLIKNNEEINWIPSHVKHGRFGKWLEGARDWSISRNRFFGCPIPVWKSTDPKYPRIDVYGSIEDLERDFNTKITDLHRPYIDQLTRPNPDDPTKKSMMVRVPEVLDCWFESGSMPYAQLHYPFENKDFLNANIPADFITEGDGQLRGWFYLLLVLSTALFDKPAFKNVISYGTIVDETGKKLSKRWRNYIDPYTAFNMYGSDAIRWLMLKSPILKGEEIQIAKDGKDLRESLRLGIKPIINAYNFFCLYANSDGIKAVKSFDSTNMMDKYILSKLKVAITQIEYNMNLYEIGNACREAEKFIEVLNNWYIRRNKNRFWKKEKDKDKQSAYNTLFTVLTTISEAIAPLMPFTSEYIWKGLCG